MHLKQIKLAGFKSFVEPTVIPLPSCLVGVVGPNGCGKSNVIDAIRWVMGESAAKTLRGESMTDVIFKGSTHRKAVGQASVELIFDHQLGRLSGPWAQYKEISVKRIVTRDGESTFFLNGTRCRRRDIIDLFSGTGVGARSYSIIGQDTVTRLITAHPDDLRVYIEEAAGVSKYKTRRAQTVTHIQHTRENLERIALVREELSHQLVRLEQQAQDARRYKALKTEERQLRAHKLVLQWQACEADLRHWKNTCSENLLQQDAQQAKYNHFLQERDSLLEKTQCASQEQEKMHTELTLVTQELHQLEASMQRCIHEKERLIVDGSVIEQDLTRLQAEQRSDQTQYEEYEQQTLLLQEQRRLAVDHLHTQEHAFAQEQLDVMQWTEQSAQMQAQIQQTQQELHIAKVRLTHLEQQKQQWMQKIRVVEEECLQIQAAMQSACLDTLEKAYSQSMIDVETAISLQQDLIAEGQRIRLERTQHEHSLQQANDTLQAYMMEQAALLAAQKSALCLSPTVSNDVLPWEKQLRVLDLVVVDDEWIAIAEAILGDDLQAHVVHSIHEWTDYIPTLVQANVRLTQESKLISSTRLYPRFIDKLKGITPTGAYDWSNIFAADTLRQALIWLDDIQEHQSIVTLDGYWLSRTWIKTLRPLYHDEEGLLARQKKLKDLEQSVSEVRKIHAMCIQKRDEIMQAYTLNEQAQTMAQERLSVLQKTCRDSESVLRTEQKNEEWRVKTYDRLQEEQHALRISSDTLLSQERDLHKDCQKWREELYRFEQQYKDMLQQKHTWERMHQTTKQTLENARDTAQQIILQHEKNLAKREQKKENLQRLLQQKQLLETRLAGIHERLHGLNEPDKALEERLQQQQEHRALLEKNLQTGRLYQEEIYQHIKQLEHTVQQEENILKRLHTEYQQADIQVHVLTQKQESIQSEFQVFNASLETCIQNLPDKMTSKQIESRLSSLLHQVKQLGSINLLAVDEYEVELARKNNIDQQYNDLIQALETLDSAIKKLDQDTEKRFHETFLQVNDAFAALFPRLFGGGYAQLQLNCDNLLEAGVVIHVQPPGKRHSTIHMLSGGEKALTAVALIFAIFQLNPSPFCLLDEVDAPLDDTNVRRFCELVKEMSNCVQFLFITHNKTTMLLADQLIGVTMQEPGVSCIVAVDVETMIGVE